MRIFNEARADRTRRGMGTTATVAALDGRAPVRGARSATAAPTSCAATPRAGQPRPVARQPADRSGPAHRRRSRDLRAQQHHPAGARHGRDRAGGPHVRRPPAGRSRCCSARTASPAWCAADEIREVLVGARRRRSKRAASSSTAPTAPAATTTSRSSFRLRRPGLEPAETRRRSSRTRSTRCPRRPRPTRPPERHPCRCR